MNRKSFRKNKIIAFAIVAALLITTAFAFLTASETSTNMFTVGNVDVELTEPNWVPDTDSDGDGVNDTLSNILAGQVIAKDPTIKNTGINDAYVYIMIEVPKANDVEILDNGTVKNIDQCQLFDYTHKDEWTLIAQNVNNKLDKYNYYVYAYNTELQPGNETILFNEVTFANITPDYINNAIDGDELNLNIKVTGYAIQSDFYGNEANNAASAWKLYVNQNGWQWPSNRNENVISINYVDETGRSLYTEYVDTGKPTELYYSSGYARTGYFFEWINSSTKETAYSGMKLYEDTTLVATYTETGYGETPSDYFLYLLNENENKELELSLVGVDVTNDNYPQDQSNRSNLIIPASLTFELPDLSEFEDGLYAVSADSGVILVPTGFYSEPSEIYTVSVTNIEDEALHSYYALDSSKQVTSVNAYYDTVIIPDSVTRIGENAFAYVGLSGDLLSIENIKMSYGVKSIEEGAFGGSTELLSVKLPTSLNHIGELAFSGCTSLTSLEISNGVSVIESGAFDSCSSLKTVNIPENITTINEDTFVGCYMLASIELHNGITKIEDRAFESCESLTSINIPYSVVDIGENVFRNCTNLERITVDENNIDYTSDSVGVLFDKQMTTLKQYPLGSNETTYSIPETVKTIKSYAFCNSKLEGVTVPAETTIIDNNAFRNCTKLNNILIKSSKISTIEDSVFNGCTSLESLVIPQGITQIKSSAFYGCTNLNTVRIPNSVVSVGFGAFNKCTSLSSVFYTGSESEWSTIKISSNNSPLTSAQVNYNA